MLKQEIIPLKLGNKDNQKIKQLLRNKLSPLHTQMKTFPRMNNTSEYKDNQAKKSAIDNLLLMALIRKCIFKTFQVNSQNENLELIHRAKVHLIDKKHISNIQYKKEDLSTFIQLFSKKNYQSNIKLRQSKSKTPKRISPIYSYIYNSSPYLTNSQIGDFTPQQISNFNAKIRRKFNHKKIVEMSKRK